MTKKEMEVCDCLVIAAVVIIIGVVAGVLGKISQVLGPIIPFVIIISIIMFYGWYKKEAKKARREALMQKYNDESIVNNIMGGMIWQQQTAEQLTDALGKPHAIDSKILKTKKKEVWKYHHQGANRYALRIILEDDVVIGWDKKAF